MSTLYRDYRPQNFTQVLGQNHIKVTLQNEIASGRPASAYLFCGPRAVGKTTLARILAKAVNCLNRQPNQSEPCNTCANCLSITSGHNLDVVEIDAASNTGIDNVRENIIAFSRLTPVAAPFKVFIIDEVHMLSLSAFNALLKIIEEPPSYVIFILCTTEIQKVPSTVASRCERFDFQRISVKDIVKKLSHIAQQEKISVETEVLEAVARRSSGHLRDAESLLGQIFSLGDKKITKEQAELVMPHYNSSEAIDLLDHLARKDAAKAIALINRLADSGLNVKVFTAEIVSLLRKIMLSKLNPELMESLGLNLGESLEKQLSVVSATLDWEQIFSFTRRFLTAANDTSSPLIPQLPLELAVAELCLGQGSPATSPETDRPTLPTPPTSPTRSNQAVSRPTLKPKPASPTTATLAAEPAVRHSINLNKTAVQNKWLELLLKIKRHNHSLSFVLQNCEPQEIREGKLGLIFKYKFHRDRMNDVGIKTIVENSLQEVFGTNLSFYSQIDENLEIRREEPLALAKNAAASAVVSPKATPIATASQPKKNLGLMTDLLKTFGGEIIN